MTCVTAPEVPLNFVPYLEDSSDVSEKKRWRMEVRGNLWNRSLDRLRCVPVKNHDHTKRYRHLIAWAFSKEKMPVRKATQRSFQVDLTMKYHQTLRFKMFHLQECTFLGMIAPRRLVWKIQHWRCRNYDQERKAKIPSILHHVNLRRTIFWNARYCPPIPYRVSLCTTVVR